MTRVLAIAPSIGHVSGILRIQPATLLGLFHYFLELHILVSGLFRALPAFELVGTVEILQNLLMP